MAMLRLVAAAQSPQKTVLVLIPLQRGSSMSLDIDDTIRTVLNDGLAGQLDYYTEYLDVARFPEPDYQRAVRDFFRRKYAKQTFDMVIATTDITLEFVRAYRDELFPAAAVVSGVSSPLANLSTPRAGPRATGVVLPVDLKKTIDVAIQLQPDLRDVFVVSGASDTDGSYQSLARAQFRAFDGRIRFTYSSGLAIQDVLRRVSALPQHTIVFFLSFFDDGHNSKFDELKALDQVAAVANVPTYVWIDTRMGHGSVGGSVFSVERAAGAIANVALRVLKGESPENIPVREIDAHITQFDWRQLRRFGLSETRLPAGSLVKFREPSLWEQYKFYIVGAAGVVVLQTTLIAGLLLHRARLRRSHQQNQELAGRLITAQEVERSRIARELHDDVGQRIASFSIALGTLRRRLSAAPQPVHDELASLQRETVTLGNDLRSLSHELHPALLEHLGLVDALRRRCEEVSAESGVTVALDVTSELEPVPDEVALCLYRVAQEALRNVVNHAQARSARVELSRQNGRVAMRIADDGRGFEPGTAAGRRGLGLISLDERVRMLAGTLGIESGPHIGTIISVTVPFGDPDATTTSPRRG